MKIARFESRRLSARIFDGWSGYRELESGRWIGGEGDMRRFGFNVANRHVIRIPGPEPFRRAHLSFKVLAAMMKIYNASASLIIHIFKAIFADTE